MRLYPTQRRSGSAPASPVDPQTFKRIKWRNRLNSWLILVGMTALLGFTAWILFGSTGIVWAVSASLVLLLLAPRISPAIVLRLYNARHIPLQNIPQIGLILNALAERARLPAVPKLFVIASSNMNAFAVGRQNDSAIAVTDGLLRGLNLRQLTGVLAHELSHIANDDVQVMGLADIASRLTSALQTAGIVLFLFGLWQGTHVILAAVVMFLAPMVGVLLQLALSRSREYQADLNACQLTGDPAGLASALQTLERKQGALWESMLPPGGRLPDPSVLRTHPRTQDRVERLLALTSEYEATNLQPEDPLDPGWGGNPITRRPRYRATGMWY